MKLDALLLAFAGVPDVILSMLILNSDDVCKVTSFNPEILGIEIGYVLNAVPEKGLFSF